MEETFQQERRRKLLELVSEGLDLDPMLAKDVLALCSAKLEAFAEACRQQRDREADQAILSLINAMTSERWPQLPLVVQKSYLVPVIQYHFAPGVLQGGAPCEKAFYEKFGPDIDVRVNPETSRYVFALNGQTYEKFAGEIAGDSKSLVLKGIQEALRATEAQMITLMQNLQARGLTRSLGWEETTPKETQGSNWVPCETLGNHDLLEGCEARCITCNQVRPIWNDDGVRHKGSVREHRNPVCQECYEKREFSG